MKRICLPMLIVVCLLLSGCGSGGEMKKAYRDFSAELSQADSLSFTAAVRAEYEHKTARFTLSYSEDEEGGRVTVLAPELIAGVTANVGPDSTSLEYNGVMLDTGALDNFGLSPMSALPVLVQAMREGSMDSFWAEDGKLAYQLVADDGLICTVWFEAEEMLPLRAELICDGRVTVYAEISDWSSGES